MEKKIYALRTNLIFVNVIYTVFLRRIKLTRRSNDITRDRICTIKIIRILFQFQRSERQAGIQHLKN